MIHTDDEDLKASLAKLKQFRSGFADDDMVDSQSGLTALDLDVLLGHAAQTIGNVRLPDVPM